MPARDAPPMKPPLNGEAPAPAWPRTAPNDSDSLRRRKRAVRAGQFAMILMIALPAVSAMAANPRDFTAGTVILLAVACVGYVLWNLFGTKDLVTVVLWEKATLPVNVKRVPRCGAPVYFAVQIALALSIYLAADRGHIPNFTWLELLPPVAYAVFLLEWRGIVFVSLLMIAALAACVYRWHGLSFAIFAAVAFSFAVLFSVVFSMLAVHSEKSRNDVQRLATELEAANQQLREYAVQAEELAVSRERNRIAREIHDSLGHYLTVVNVQIEAARALEATDPPRARAAIAKAQAFTQEGLQDIRRSLASLRASPLDNKSLSDALRELVQTSNGAGLPATYELQGAPRALASPAELSLYRAAQEGLTNARKHSGAGRVRVFLDFRAADRTSVVVQDDGVGAALENATGGFGLTGLRERAHLLGGSVRVDSRPNAGFTLKLEVPG